MYCPRQLSYVIRQGDTLYQIAENYRTTVSMILSQNPGIDPYNLQTGASIIICPGETSVTENIGSNCPDMSKQLTLSNAMRLAWGQHVYWTRMLLLSIVERLKDQGAVTMRLLQNPNDIANIFSDYYPPAVAHKIEMLLTEHLQIGAALITALRDGKTADADRLTRQWYINADKMVDTFGSINPYYSRKDLREMLYKHLDLTTREVAMRLAGNYPADIAAFDEVEREAIEMADYFSSGIMKQFPQRFM